MNLKQFFESLAQSPHQCPDEEAIPYLLYQSEKDDFLCPSPKPSQRATPPSLSPSLIPFWLPWLLAAFFMFLSLYFSLRDVPSEIWGSYASGWYSDFGNQLCGRNVLWKLMEFTRPREAAHRASTLELCWLGDTKRWFATQRFGDT
jgi:hypothetical protein